MDALYRHSIVKKLHTHTSWWNAISIERYVHVLCKGVLEEYQEQMYLILSNINLNTELLSLPPKRVACMTAAEMTEGTVLEKVMMQKEQMRQKYYEIVQQTTVSKGNLLTCRKCKKSDIMFEQKQTRGADEAMTIFCTCVSCNFRWKMS